MYGRDQFSSGNVNTTCILCMHVCVCGAGAWSVFRTTCGGRALTRYVDKQALERPTHTNYHEKQ